MVRTKHRKRRRARESSAKLSSESDWWSGTESVSEDDYEEAEEQERRWRTRRKAQDSKGKGKQLVKDEENGESKSSEGDENDGGDGEEEQRSSKDAPQQTLEQICGICFSECGNERGKLDCCDHFFCFDCIMEWAKVESRCPMCKQRFLIVMRPAISNVPRSRTRSFRIPTRDQVYEPSEEEIRLFTDPYQNTACTECQEAGDEGLLLLCDRCDAAAHTYCVGLGRSVPRGDWFCQACQLQSSGEEDEDDTTFDTIDVDEEEGSGTDSVMALLVADVPPNRFAGRTRRSVTTQGVVPLRRSTRRRGRRSSLTRSPRLSEALISMSSSPRRGFFPSLPETYTARTLSHQRQVQATVHSRLQNMRENWNRYRTGEVQFPSAGHSVETSRPGSDVAGGLPSSSTPRLGHAGRSTSASPMDLDGSVEAPALSQTTRGASRSAESGEIQRAWANLNRAIRLEGIAPGASRPGPLSGVGSASDRNSREVKLQGTPVSARTREKLPRGDVSTRENSSRGPVVEWHSQGDAHSRANGSRGTPDDFLSKINFFSTQSSSSRHSDTAREDKPSENCRLDISSGGGDNSRGGYQLRESIRQHSSRMGSNTKDNATTVGRVTSPILRESINDTAVLQVQSIHDDKDNSRGSGGVSTRRREAKESLQAPSIRDDKDNSRGLAGVTTRRREAKGAQSLQGKSILDDKDNSRASTGPITRREMDRHRSQSLAQGKNQSRNPCRDEEMKLMKEQCFNLVQIALKPILQKGTIDKYQFKELARSATHTILSSLGVPGLKHSTHVSIGTVTCYHEEPTLSSLVPGCCNICVQRHVKKYVKSLVKDKIDLHK